MPSAASQQQVTWLVENGPRELEALLRAIVYHPSAPILIADSDRHSLHASSGAGKLLGVPPDLIIGRSLDDFADPSFIRLLSNATRWALDMRIPQADEGPRTK